MSASVPLPPRRRWLALSGLVALLAFDGVTVVPAAAGLYVLKRAVGLDVFKDRDGLPDDVIEGGLAWVGHQLAAVAGMEADTRVSNSP